MKASGRIVLLAMLLSASTLWGQRPPNCDTSCGGDPLPTSGTGAGPLETTSFITNARGTGNLTVATQQVGKSTAIEGSQSYTYAVNLFSLPGRAGLDLNLTLYYNSLLWEYNSDNNSMVYGGFDSPAPGFRLDYGLLEFATDQSLGILTEPTGAKHLFLPTGVTNQYRTNDSTYILVQYPATAGNPVIVTYKNGLRIFYQLFDTTYQYQYRPYQIEDTNGNIISITYLNNDALSINTVTDTVGRVIRFSYDSTGKMLQAVAQLNSTGQVFRQYTFAWAQNQPLTFNFTLRATAGLGLPPGYLTSGQTTVNLLTQVTRPDGTRVIFDYVHDLNGANPDNPDWGIVKSIQEQSSTGAPRYTMSYLFPASSAGVLISNPTYTTQTVNDGVNTGIWQFQATKNTNGLVTCFAEIDPLGRLSTTTFSSNGDALDGLPIQQVMSSVAQGTSFSGCTTSVAQTWRTVKQSWTEDPGGGNARLASVTTILEDGSTQSQVKFGAYDSFGQATDLLQYDFGSGVPGALLREDITSYASLSNDIVNRLSELKIKDGNGTVVSDTKLSYDEGTLSSVSPLPVGGTHDEINYSASSTNARGNLTSVVNYTNAAAGSGAVTGTFTYDELGNQLTSQAGAGPQRQQIFSIITQYAYPDSTSVGPSGNQLTISFAYDLDRGVARTVTDPNGQSTGAMFDNDDRLSMVTSADGLVATTTYDDASPHSATSTSNTANNLVAKIVADGMGRPLYSQKFNGTSLISTSAFTNNVMGQVLQATNPYAPGDSIANTIYTYDPLGRVLTTTPPAITAAAQNPYQTQYTAGTFTDSAGNTRSGQIVTTTDPAGKQRRQYTDALGRLVRVDEPGQTGGSAGSGSITILGTEQSVSVPNGGGATAGTGSVTIGGTERSTQVLTHNATQAVGTVTISGWENSATIDPCADQAGTFGDGGGLSSCPRTIWDSGSVSMTVNGLTQSVFYGSGTEATDIAAALAGAFGNTGLYTVTASGSIVTVTANSAGASGNSITLSATSSTNDPGDFGGPSFVAQASGGTLSGGTDNGYTTMYDTGNVTVTVTIGGTAYSQSFTYGQSSTPASIASGLANKINSDTTLNQKLVASSSSNVLNLTTTATGANTADPLSASAATTSQYFASGSSSFTSAPSGTTLTPGQNGVVFDSGTIKVSISGFTSTSRDYTVNYSQGSTPVSIASAIAGAINTDTTAPVTANVASGSNVVTLTAKTLGSDTNYGISATATTSQGTYFNQPSFSGSGTSLSGGTDSTASLNTPLSTFSSYDAMSNLLKVLQGQQTRSYQYDSLGRMTSSCIPEMNYQCTTYSYTDFGAVAIKLDPRSITTTYGYDTLGRLHTITYSDGTPTVTYTYGPAGAGNNAAGRLINVGNNSAAEAYSYDGMGRVTQCKKTIGGQDYTIGYHYSQEQLDYVTYPSGRIVYQDHDAIGRLSQIRTGGTSILTIGSFNAADRVLNTSYGNGMTGTYTYNNQLQLASILASNPGAAALNLTYSYGDGNDNGQISGITDGINSARSTSYVYDELGRLKIAQTTDLTSANTWKLRFSYDRYGNRLSQIPVAGAGVMPMNESVVDSTTNRLANLTYDADGNVLKDGSHSYTYNGANQLTNVDGANNTYAYDASGLRVSKNDTIYIYSGSKPIAEYVKGAMANLPAMEYIYANSSRIASITSDTVTYYYADHLSTRIEANSSGSVIRAFGPFPFGETWYEMGAADKWKFTTYERDMESGNDYAQGRFNMPTLGRFMSPDPYFGSMHGDNPQSINRYSYAGNDAINFFDPTGLECVWDDGSFDSENDPDTGSVGSCQAAGGTWIELGQGGRWTSFPQSNLAQIVADIQNGISNIVSAMGRDGNAYVTRFDDDGRVSWTAGRGIVTVYAYAQDSVSPMASESFLDPGGAIASGYRQYMEGHPGLPLDPNDRRIYMLAVQIDIMTSNLFGRDIQESTCNFAKFELNVASWMSPFALEKPAEKLAGWAIMRTGATLLPECKPSE